MGTKHDEINPRFAEKIELKPVTWLKPYAQNARTHSPEQLDQIAGSIAQFGFVNPILAKSNGEIIAGHGRLEAATTRLDLKDVPVIVLDHLTDEQARILVLADNKIAMNAGWDEDMLAAELQAMEAEGFDLTLTGFDEDELEDLLGEIENDPPPADQKEQEESEFQTITFNLHKDQMAILKAAMRGAHRAGDYTEDYTEDKQANALARIANYYNEGNRETVDKPSKSKKATAKKTEQKKGAKTKTGKK